jgi:hypothetical protein
MGRGYKSANKFFERLIYHSFSIMQKKRISISIMFALVFQFLDKLGHFFTSPLEQLLFTFFIRIGGEKTKHV